MQYTRVSARRDRIDFIVMQIRNLNKRMNRMKWNEKYRMIRSNEMHIAIVTMYFGWVFTLDTHLIYDSATYEICIGIDPMLELLFILWGDWTWGTGRVFFFVYLLLL